LSSAKARAKMRSCSGNAFDGIRLVQWLAIRPPV
jgi:hypothetical protein